MRAVYEARALAGLQGYRWRRQTHRPQAWRAPRGRLSAAALSRMAMKSMNAVLTAAVGSELVSSLQGTLLQSRVRRQFRRGRTGLCFGRIKAGCARERGRARGASRRQAMLSAHRVQWQRSRRHGRATQSRKVAPLSAESLNHKKEKPTCVFMFTRTRCGNHEKHASANRKPPTPGASVGLSKCSLATCRCILASLSTCQSQCRQRNVWLTSVVWRCDRCWV